MAERMAEQARNIPTGDRAQRVYTTLEEALSRFRLMPPQAAGNLFIADYIARRSLKTVTGPDGVEGWSWRFDPNMWAKLDRSVMSGLMDGGPPKVSIPLVHIYGDRSAIISRKKEGGPSPLPPPCAGSWRCGLTPEPRRSAALERRGRTV
jgi:hypothetical protein